jgi:hypothetical protein
MQAILGHKAIAKAKKTQDTENYRKDGDGESARAEATIT